MTVPVRTSERRESVHARRLERRRELLRAAMDVIRRGGADATMEEMASAGGISKPILYRHFTDREGLVAAITEHALGVLGRIIDENLEVVRTGNWRDTVRATIAAFFEYVENEPELYRFVIEHDARQGSQATHAFTEKMAEHVAKAIAGGLQAAGLDTSPAEVWGRAIIGMVQSVGDWWVGGSATSRADVVESLTDLAWGGIRGPHNDADLDSRVDRPRTRKAVGE
jgi:AcrR family transcriptional regulator